MSVYKLNEAINDYNLRLGEYTDSLSTHIKLHVTEKYSEAECLDMEPLITMLTGYIIKSGLYEDVVFHLDKAEDIREVTKQSKAYFVETIMSQYISGDMICEAIEKEVVDFTFFVLEVASINHLESIGKLDSVEEEEPFEESFDPKYYTLQGDGFKKWVKQRDEPFDPVAIEKWVIEHPEEFKMVKKRHLDHEKRHHELWNLGRESRDCVRARQYEKELDKENDEFHKWFEENLVANQMFESYYLLYPKKLPMELNGRGYGIPWDYDEPEYMKDVYQTWDCDTKPNPEYYTLQCEDFETWVEQRGEAFNPATVEKWIADHPEEFEMVKNFHINRNKRSMELSDREGGSWDWDGVYTEGEKSEQLEKEMKEWDDYNDKWHEENLVANDMVHIYFELHPEKMTMKLDGLGFGSGRYELYGKDEDEDEEDTTE